MFAYSALSGILHLNPQLAKTRRLAEVEGAASPDVNSKIRGLLMASRIELALLILIVFDMVVKPFS
jgi:hypothetical protein